MKQCTYRKKKLSSRFVGAYLSLALIGSAAFFSGGGVPAFADNTTPPAQGNGTANPDPDANLSFKNSNLDNDTLDQLAGKLKLLPETVENNALLKKNWDELGAQTSVAQADVKDIQEFGGWKAINNGKFAIARKTANGIFPLETINTTLDDTVWLREQAFDRTSEYILFLSQTRTIKTKDELSWDSSEYKYRDEPGQIAKALKGFDGIEKTFKAYSPENGSRVKIAFKVGYSGDIDGTKAKYKVEVFKVENAAETSVYSEIVDPTQTLTNDKMTVTKATDGTGAEKIRISNTSNKDAGPQKTRDAYIGDDKAEAMIAQEANKPNGQAGTFTSSEIELPKGVTDYKVKISIADKDRTGMSYQAWDKKYSLPMFGNGFSITQDTKSVAKYIFTKIYSKMNETKAADTKKKTDASVQAYDQALTEMKALVDAPEVKTNEEYRNAFAKAEEAKRALVSAEPAAIEAVIAAFAEKMTALNENKSLTEKDRKDAEAKAKAVKDAAIANIKQAADVPGINQARDNGIAEINKINPVGKDGAVAAIRRALSDKEKEVDGAAGLSEAEKDKFKKEARSIADKQIAVIEQQASREDSADKAKETQAVVDGAKASALADLMKINPVGKDGAVAAIRQALSDKEKEIDGAAGLSEAEKDKFKKEARSIADKQIAVIEQQASREDSADKAKETQAVVDGAKASALAEIGKIKPVASKADPKPQTPKVPNQTSHPKLSNTGSSGVLGMVLAALGLSVAGGLALRKKKM